MARKHTLTGYVDAETAGLLKRMAEQEWRSESSMIGMLIRQEAARRGMLGRAPQSEAVPEKISPPKVVRS